MKTYKLKSGLTLIELMVTIAVASIVVLTIVLVLTMAFRSWRINNAFVDLRRGAALATDLISRDVHESSFTNISWTGTQLILDQHPPVRDNVVTYTKNGDTLVSSSFGLIIPRGVRMFSAQPVTTGDGVYVTLVLTNQYNIAITNTLFVNTRN